MWCERVIRNAANFDPRELENRAIDYVDLEWNQSGPALKTRSRRGEDVRIVLGAGQRLHHGDIIFEDGQRLLAVNVRACEVIVARPTDIRSAATLALELGNLHWPTQLDGADIIFREEASLLAVLETLRIAWSCEVRRFQPAEVMAGPSARLSTTFQVIRGGTVSNDDASRGLGARPK